MQLQLIRLKGGIRDEKWSKPEPRQVKLNVDAAFHIETRTGSVAAVLRDYKGNLLGAKCVFISHVASAVAAEALAMREGLNFAVSVGCNDVIAESDSVEVIDSCSGKEIWWNESVAVFADIVDISSSLDKVIFKHCARNANKVAHELAKFSFDNEQTCNWANDPPSFLLSCLINDVTVL
jgi:ribonuclease HI